MTNNNLLKLNDDTKNLIMEVSALSGIPQNVVKEVIEYMLVSWAVKIADNPNDFAPLVIPYIGTLNIKYEKDRLSPEGDIITDVEHYVDISDNFRKLIGDMYYEKDICLTSMLQKKIEQAVMVASTPN